MGNCLNAETSPIERRLSACENTHPSLYEGLTWIQTSEILAKKFEVIGELGRGGVGEVHLVQTRNSFFSYPGSGGSHELEVCYGSRTQGGSPIDLVVPSGNNDEGEVDTKGQSLSSMYATHSTSPVSSNEETHQKEKKVLPPNLRIDDTDSNLCFSSGTEYTPGRSLLNGVYGPSPTVRERGHLRKYAMKTMYLERVHHKRYRELEHEVLVLKQLDHPNIVRCREVFLYDEKICMILDLCEGGTLRNVEFNEVDTCGVITQILRALKYLHYTCGIAHRDLKLENIMLESKRRPLHVRLVDFGLSSTFCKGKKLIGAGGTPYSMAPELILEGEGYTDKTDMWSLGVIIYMLLGRSCPFLRDSNDLGDPKYMDRFSLAQYSLDEKIWDNVSDPPKELIKNLFVRSPVSRWDACVSLDHCENVWMQELQMTTPRVNDGELSEFDSNRNSISSQDICKSMRNFSSYSQLKKAILMIAAFTSPPEEVAVLREVFLEINADKTGHIKCQVMECDDDNFLSALLACSLYSCSTHPPYSFLSSILLLATTQSFLCHFLSLANPKIRVLFVYAFSLPRNLWML